VDHTSSVHAGQLMTKSSDTTKLARQYQQIFDLVSSQLHTYGASTYRYWFGGPGLLMARSTTKRELLRPDLADKGVSLPGCQQMGWNIYDRPDL
jgi:hypothetical protein